MYDEDSDSLFAGARSRDIWIRGLLALLFLAVLWFIRLVVLILAAFQFVYAIVTGGPNRRLLPFSQSVATYMQQMAAFVTWNTEIRPYPFSPWPTDEADFPDDPIRDTPPPRSRDWDEPDEPFEPDEPDVTDEPPASGPAPEAAVDEPPAPPKPKPRSGGAKRKKKKKSSPPKASDEPGSAGDDSAGI